jgi:hypothetical protein
MPREEVSGESGSLWKRISVAVIVWLALLYAVDYALLRHKMANPDQTVAFGTITSFYGTATKGGKMEIFTDQPQTETCVHSLFPHSGYRACWYISHGSVNQI